ncbi:MAG: AsmA-like C-terminal region-containing protein, partial [Gammaproteobacteria bacterium]
FVAPQQPSAQNPVIVDLSYLQIDKLEAGAEETEIRPSDLVDFRLNSDTLRFHEVLYNDLQVEARVIGDKLQVDKLSMRKDNLILKALAYWEYDLASKSHLSSVALSIKGDEMGQALTGMGFGNTMTNGTLNFYGGFTWPAPLTSFTPETLAGDAKFRIENGILNNVEPGTGGKFVGLLSLSALPRRLSLDFSDMLIEGMDFDKIDGSYRIEDGIIHTRNTRLEGVAARIKISGKTDIARREYDQTIIVTPKIRQTLPIIGAVSAGSTVGWGLLLLQNLFKKSIDKAVEVEYRVTGSWDDPQIELIKAVDENQRELPKIDR